MTRALFVCGKACKRGPTAADLARAGRGLEIDYAGLSNDADAKPSRGQIDQAGRILVIDRSRRFRRNARFGVALAGRKLSVHNILDRFGAIGGSPVTVLERRLEHPFGAPA